MSLTMVANVGHMSSGGFRSSSLSTEAEIAIELLPLATHKPRHYLYAVLAEVFFNILVSPLSIYFLLIFFFLQ